MTAEDLQACNTVGGHRPPLQKAGEGARVCGRASITTVDTGGRYSTLTIGTDGFGLVSYINNGLRVAHLSNTIGNPYVRRR
jgi:hypothetical protein